MGLILGEIFKQIIVFSEEALMVGSLGRVGSRRRTPGLFELLLPFLKRREDIVEVRAFVFELFANGGDGLEIKEILIEVDAVVLFRGHDTEVL